MKAFTEGQDLILIASSGPEKVTYVALSGERHLVRWTVGKMPMSAFVTDDNLFPDTRYGLRSAIDAEVERRYNNALADMKAGNPTATHLVHTHQIIAAWLTT